MFCFAGWSSLVAREAHNLKVTGSNPVPVICPFNITNITNNTNNNIINIMLLIL